MSVRLSERVVRFSRRAPTRSSSRLTALLIAEGDIPRVCAAATKLWASTTRTKATMSLKLFKRSPYSPKKRQGRPPCRQSALWASIVGVQLVTVAHEEVASERGL